MALPAGVVVIGRNEGPRLARALDSVRQLAEPIVYVDSGSTDDSVAQAQTRSVAVVDLDMSVPFTAARARNAGWRKLRELAPDLPYALFIDGDCEVLAGFLEPALEVLESQPDVVAVCGYRRERYPERSPLNRVCDVEWRSGNVGDCKAFGGDVVVRLEALTAAGGYDESVIAAEDDELAIRLRAAGGRIHRINVESTLHDANMTRLSEWWRRAVRCGYAFAQVNNLHGQPPERYFMQEKKRSLTWGAALPAAAVGLAPLTLGASLSLLGLYPIQAVRIAQGTQRRGFRARDAWAWGVSCSLSKIPEAVGIGRFHLDRLRKRQPEIIEYKGDSNSQS